MEEPMKRPHMFGIAIMIALIACGWLPTPQATPTQEVTMVDSQCNKRNQELQWDFSQDHLTSSTGYPDDCWAAQQYLLTLHDSRIEVLLPEGLQIGPIDSPRISVSRNGLERHLIGDILVKYTNYLTADEAYEWAMQLAEQYDLPSRNLDEWYAHAKANPTNPTSIGGWTARYLEDGSSITVKVSLSFDKERPYNLYVQFLWPYDLDAYRERQRTPTP